MYGRLSLGDLFSLSRSRNGNSPAVGRRGSWIMQRLWSVCGDRRTTDVAGNGSAAPVVLLGYLALEQKPPPDEGQQLVGVEAACGLRQASLRDLCCATIKTGHPATICHTSDGGAVSG